MMLGMPNRFARSVRLLFTVQLLSLVVLSACTARTDLWLPGEQLGDDCLENAECPEACIGGTCAEYASGGEVCDDPEDCADAGYVCPAEFCVEPLPGFVLVSPGTFTMGSPPGEEGRFTNETERVRGG